MHTCACGAGGPPGCRRAQCGASPPGLRRTTSWPALPASSTRRASAWPSSTPPMRESVSWSPRLRRAPRAELSWAVSSERPGNGGASAPSLPTAVAGRQPAHAALPGALAPHRDAPGLRGDHCEQDGRNCGEMPRAAIAARRQPSVERTVGCRTSCSAIARMQRPGPRRPGSPGDPMANSRRRSRAEECHPLSARRSVTCR
jgi:hypothetical protein